MVLPSNGSVPGMPGWRWIYSPGYSPGHAALYIDSNRVLIAEDAIQLLSRTPPNQC